MHFAVAFLQNVIKSSYSVSESFHEKLFESTLYKSLHVISYSRVVLFKYFRFRCIFFVSVIISSSQLEFIMKRAWQFRSKEYSHIPVKGLRLKMSFKYCSLELFRDDVIFSFPLLPKLLLLGLRGPELVISLHFSIRLTQQHALKKRASIFYVF